MLLLQLQLLSEYLLCSKLLSISIHLTSFVHCSNTARSFTQGEIELPTVMTRPLPCNTSSSAAAAVGGDSAMEDD
jgi:hypothetical protein